MTQSSSLSRVLPRETFKHLRNLWRQMAQNLGQGAVLLTEDVLSPLIIPPQRTESFAVLLSEQFSALLIGDASDPNSPTQNSVRAGLSEILADSEILPKNPPLQTQKYLNVKLSFEPDVIAAFLTQLFHWLEGNPIATKLLSQATASRLPNDAKLQSEFTLSLLELLSTNLNKNETPKIIYPYVSVCQPVENALRQQFEQERLLNQVTTQIRQSLELPVILTTAVEQVRSFLQADRLVVYEFGGQITYESRASEAIPSVLHLAEEKHCFINVSGCYEKYRQGFTLAVEDIETGYIFSPCILDLLRRTQVKSKLVVPIVVQEELWGLLIAHQCVASRQWQDNEKTFLQHIAEHLAIAIYQAQLYAQVQQQKQTLEQRVIERTQELHDALLVAESANKSKSEFLAAMNHELRTPLTCIIGLSSTLLRRTLGQLSPKQEDYLRIINNSGEHLLELINDILDLSQVEAGKTVLNISKFSISQQARQIVQMLKEKAAIRGIDLRLELGNLAIAGEMTGKENRLIADPKRCKQILINLVSNGIKFTPQGGQVILRVWQEKKHAIFQVEDTGIGIPEHQRSLLFQKFRQLDTSYHRKYEGTGLGLALTKQLVALHGGQIEVESTVGVGSTFTVRLPHQPMVKDEAGKIKNEKEDSSLMLDSSSLAGRIFLIEDQEEIAILICDVLTSAGYQVVWLIEGSTAIEQIELLQPTAIIIDLQLPGIDVNEISNYVRQLPAIPNIKILALTASEMPKVGQSNSTAIADEYLLLPLQPEQLLRKLQLLIARG